MAFDVMLCPETGNIKKAPPNLPKLERRKRGKKLTKEELEEKMRKATERRKVIFFLVFKVDFPGLRCRSRSNVSRNLDESLEIYAREISVWCKFLT